MLNLRVEYPDWRVAVRAIATQLLAMFRIPHTWTQAQDFDGGLTVGQGAAVTKVLSATATLDFPSVGSNGMATLTATVTGAAEGDVVIAAPPAAFESGFTFCAFVSAANTVKVRIHNNNGGAVDPASGTWRITVISHA